VPAWLVGMVEALSPDNLRRFLIFCTGSPSLPPEASSASSSSSSSRSSSKFEIGVQYQRRSEALPVAHTCFLKLDLPDYADEATLAAKLMKAIQECGTFDRA
jgi:hypothetical protein